jgi:hypothetical protein
MKIRPPNGPSLVQRTSLHTSMRILPLLAFVCLWVLAAGCTDSRGEESFDTFWARFREAVLAHDAGRVVALTAFPFKTRGPLDSDAVRSHDTAGFRNLFEKLLQQDSGASKDVESMQKFIERTPRVSDKSYGDGGASARVGAFLFQKIEGQWRFVLAYIDG